MVSQSCLQQMTKTRTPLQEMNAPQQFASVAQEAPLKKVRKPRVKKTPMFQPSEGNGLDMLPVEVPLPKPKKPRVRKQPSAMPEEGALGYILMTPTPKKPRKPRVRKEPPVLLQDGVTCDGLTTSAPKKTRKPRAKKSPTSKLAFIPMSLQTPMPFTEGQEDIGPPPSTLATPVQGELQCILFHTRR